MSTQQLDSGRLISHDSEIKVVTNPNNTHRIPKDYEATETYIAQSCNNCLFAKIERNRQIGCDFNRLQQYAKTTDVTYIEKRYESVNVLSNLYPELFENSLSLKRSNQYVLAEYRDGELFCLLGDYVDEVNPLHEASYAVIDDRYCNLYRHKYSDWAKSTSGILNQMCLARQEVDTRVSAMIYFDKTHSVGQLRATINSCLEQLMPVAQIIVLNNQSDIAVSEVLKQMMADHPTIPWTNSRSLWDSADIGLCFDDALGQETIQGNYFFLVNAGTNVDDELLETLDESLNDKLERWVCLTSGDMLVAQTKVAKLLDGFQEIKPTDHDQFIYGLENKIRWFADKTGQSHFVKELSDVVK